MVSSHNVHTACAHTDLSLNHTHKYAHQHKMLCPLCIVKDAMTVNMDWSFLVRGSDRFSSGHVAGQ